MIGSSADFLSLYLYQKSDKFALKAARVAEGETPLCPLILVNAVLKEVKKRGDSSWYWDDEIGCAVFYSWEPEFFKFTNVVSKEDLEGV